MCAPRVSVRTQRGTKVFALRKKLRIGTAFDFLLRSLTRISNEHTRIKLHRLAQPSLSSSSTSPTWYIVSTAQDTTSRLVSFGDTFSSVVHDDDETVNAKINPRTRLKCPYVKCCRNCAICPTSTPTC